MPQASLRSDALRASPPLERARDRPGVPSGTPPRRADPRARPALRIPAEPRERDAEGNLESLVTIVTYNGGPFRFEAFIATHPELRQVRTRGRLPGQNGSRGRGFGSLKYERLFLEEIDDVLDLTVHAERLPGRLQHRPPARGPSWNRPHDVHTGAADPSIPNLPEPEILPTD